MGRKAKSLTGGTKASHNALIMTVGFFGGTISDVLLYSLKFPGYDSKIATCDALTMGDIGELLFFGFLTWIGTLYNRRDLSAFSFGLLAGKLFPTVFTPALPGVSRYVAFDLDRATGHITPGFSATEKVGQTGQFFKDLPSNAGKFVGDIPGQVASGIQQIPGIIDNSNTSGYAQSNFVQTRHPRTR